jgi:two-component system, NarL family, invasion response regulator UvrY
MRQIRVMVVDDNERFRDLLGRFVARHPDMLLVGTADGGESAVSLGRDLRPDVVLMDLRMPGTDGFEATLRLKADDPGVGVIALTAYRSVDNERRCREAQADAFLMKAEVDNGLLYTIRALGAGRRHLRAQRRKSSAPEA